MKEEKEKLKSEKKIVIFDIDESVMTDEEIDRFLTESLLKEADDLETELNQDPVLLGADVSDTMFQSIVRQLKEKGIWEEEEDKEPAQEPESQDAERAERLGEGDVSDDQQHKLEDSLDLEKLYAMLPEEDRRALAIGKQTEKEHEAQAAKKKKRRKVLKYGGTAAAILVLVFSGSMTIEANRRLVKKAWDGMMYNLGYRMSTNYTGEEENVRSKTKEEMKAMEEIQAELGISAISLEYMPEEMKYLNYEIMQDFFEATIFYDYQGKIFSLSMINVGEEGDAYYSLDNEAMLVDTVTNEQNLKIEIRETNLDLEIETYIAEIEYNDCRYILNGIIPLAELKEIAKNIIFL